jgi:hypothetical protein
VVSGRQRRRAIAASVLGIAVAAAYVRTVVVAGSRDLLVRRPLLDGFITPQAYNWVSPPPALRSTNKQPAAGHFTMDIVPATGSPAKVFTTTDSQASIALAQGAIRASNGDSAAIVAISPLAAKGFGAPPGRATIAGNVYRYAVSLRPSGTAVSTFRVPGQVVLAYPAPPTRTGYHHDILYSADGKSWTKLRSIDSPTQQLAQADASAPGHFAVGQTLEGAAGSGGGRSWGNIIVTAVVVLIVAGIVVAILVSEVRLRSRRAEGEWTEDESEPGRRSGRWGGRSAGDHRAARRRRRR